MDAGVVWLLIALQVCGIVVGYVLCFPFFWPFLGGKPPFHAFIWANGGGLAVLGFCCYLFQRTRLGKLDAANMSTALALGFLSSLAGLVWAALLR